MALPDFQSITAIRHEGAFGEEIVAKVPLTELCANWTVAANQAQREGLPGVAQRLRNDVEFFKRYGSDITIEIGT